MKLFLLLCSLFTAATLGGQEMPRSYAVIVIGGGPAGLACATACAKSGYGTLVCDKERGAILHPDLPVTNWPGLPSMPWKAVVEGLRKELDQCGGTFVATGVKSINRNQGMFHVTTGAGVFHAPALVMATGRQPSPMKFPVNTELPTRVVSRLYDPSFLRPTDTVILIGSGEYALSCAIRMATKVKQIYLFLQPPFTSTGTAVERIAKKLPSITWMYSDAIRTVNSYKDKVVVEYLSKKTKAIQEASWVVFATEWIPQSYLVAGQTKTDSTGSIITYSQTGATETSGLFACGEVTSPGVLTGIAAAAHGLATSNAVCQFLAERYPLPQPRTPPNDEPPPHTGQTGGTGE